MSPHAHISSMPTPCRVAVAWAVSGMVFTATQLALVAACMASAYAPGSALLWALVLPILLLGGRIARRAFAERAGMLASMLGLIALPPACAGAADALDDLLVPGPHAPPLGLLRAVILFFVFSFVVIPAALAVAWKPRRGLDAATRALAYAAVGAAVVLAVAASVRALHRPAPDDYVASLPLAATLATEKHAVADDGRLRLTRRAPRRSQPPWYEFPAETCPFDVSVFHEVGDHLDRVVPSNARSACARIGVRQDDAHGYWIFTNEGPAQPVPLFAIDMNSENEVSVGVHRIAASLSAPPGWIALAGAGALVAAVSLLVGRRRVRALRERLTAIEAAHLGNGRIRVGESPPFVDGRAAALPAGPVLLVGVSRAAAASAYRESASPLAPREVLPGALDDARAAVASAIASQHAFAFVCAALAAAPLAVAACENLVF